MSPIRKRPPTKKLKVPLGPPLALSEADIELAARVTEMDKAATADLWQRSVVPAFRGLLDAIPDAQEGES